MKEPAFRETDLFHVEAFIWAGDAAPKIMVDVLGAVCAPTGGTLINGYGCTEVAGKWITG